MRRQEVIRLALAALVVALLFGSAVALRPIVAAETAAGSAEAESAEAPSLFARAAVWMITQQNRLHRELAGDLRRVSTDGYGLAAMILVATSFLYGVFHAVGPGHGKVLLTTYLFADTRRSCDRVWLAVAAAFVQGLVAVVLVYGLIELAGWVARDAQIMVAWSERLSFALVILVGAALLARVLGRNAHIFRRAPGAGASHDDHHHDHDHAGHTHDAPCGHAHVFNAAQLNRAADFRTRLALVMSIGLRPYTGAVLVLILAQASGIAGAGIAAVAAMSTGTALAIAGIALIAVNAWPLALSLLGRSNGRLELAMDVLAALGGAAIIAIGGLLLFGSFAPLHPLGY